MKNIRRDNLTAVVQHSFAHPCDHMGRPRVFTSLSTLRVNSRW